MRFSDGAIRVCLTPNTVFGPALRQVTGLVASVLQLAKLDRPVPDHTTLCRRQKRVTVSPGGRASTGGLHLPVDGTGCRRGHSRAPGWPAMDEGRPRRRIPGGETLRAMERPGRTIWKKWSGYHRRSLVETKMHCFKLPGERVAARTFV